MNPMLVRIRWRMVGWSLLVIMAVLIAVGTAVYAAAAAGLRDQVDRDLRDRANAVAGRSAHEISEAERALGPEGFRGSSFELLVGPGGAIVANPQRLGPADLRALSGTSSGFLDATVNGEPARAYAAAMSVGSQALQLVVGTSIASERQSLARLLGTLLVTGVGSLVLAFVGATFLAHRALVPIEDAFRRQREFVAEASHELRTPLTVLRAATDLLDQHRSEALAANSELLADIRHELDRTDRLVDDLLTLARSDLGELTLAVGRVDLAALAAGTVRRATRLAEARGVVLGFHHDDGSALVVEADPDRLEQALLVLIGNAVEHTHRGGHVDVTPSAERGAIVVRVRDEGPGIPRDELPHVFDRFYRGSGSRVSRNGAGLGLAIARSLIQAHGGTLALESADGTGTIATMRLPSPS